MTGDPILVAEQAWRAAHEEHERRDTLRTLRAEEAAWDAYAELCDEAGQCLQPGCRTHTPEWAWCEEHRS